MQAQPGSDQQGRQMPRDLTKRMIGYSVVVAFCLAGIFLVWKFQGGGQAAGPSGNQPPVNVQELRAKAEAGEAAAQAQLGSLYVKGEVVTNSYAEAARWFRFAAEQGNPEGLTGLGQLYEAGQGVSKDMDEAIKCYRKAAEQGYPLAQYTMGFLYEAGRGVPKDHVEAAKWFRKAADQGEPLSQYDLGQRYELGIGVQADRAEALKWFTLAAAQGQADALQRRDQLRKEMSRDDIAEAERRLAAFSAPKAKSP